MSFRSNHPLTIAGLCLLLSAAGIACDKFSKPSAVPNNEVVAVVDGTQITFGDWMQQLDLLRVSVGASVDPDNSEQVRQVLDSLVDQQLVLAAAKKADFHDPEFDANVKTRLLDADLKIKEIKERLRKDMATVERIEKNYQEPLKKMLLAREFMADQVSKVVVTDKDIRDWYSQYSQQMEAAGQKLPPYGPQVSGNKKVRAAVQAEKYITNLRASGQVVNKKETIEKYLNTLSASRRLLSNPEKGGDMPSLDLKANPKK